jgi:PIN domain nuclease of toxin-antitoxin system
VKLLLDSHAYLWWLTDDRRLGRQAHAAIEEPDNLIFVSAATIWELSIKEALGRLELRGTDLAGEISANDFSELPITAGHARAAAALPRHHDDPFDRVLVAQCQVEGMTCATRDGLLVAYGISLLW